MAVKISEEEFQRRELLLCEYIRALLRHMGQPEHVIEVEIETLLTPPENPQNNGQSSKPSLNGH